MNKPGKHSLALWCYECLGLERLIGLHTLHGWDLELVPTEHWTLLKKHNVVNAMSLILYPNGPAPFEIGFGNRKEWDQVIAATKTLVEQTAHAGYPNVIAFTGYGELSTVTPASLQTLARLWTVSGDKNP